MKNQIILIVCLAVIIGAYCFFGPQSSQGISMDEAKGKIQKLIDANPENTATITGITKENNLYKITVSAGGQEMPSYLSLDGKQFFPQVIDLEEMEKTLGEAPKAEVSVKSNKPKVEVFVMSHCPYGTQIEKGFLPVLAILGDKIDFELKFCDYAMHGKPELDEQIQQYCVQKQGGAQLLSYLNCFLAEGNSAQCLATTQINHTTFQTCVTNTDNQYKITEQFNNKETWQGGQFPVFDVHKEDNLKYQIGGSPELVINGEKITTDRDAQSLLNTICSGFKTQPTECQTTLSSETPSRGFGFTTTADDSNASCN